MAGYKIPVLSSSGKCHEVSGSSIAAPLFAGYAVLRIEKEKIEMSPGLLRCRLHDSCVFPRELRIPDESFPYFGSGLLDCLFGITR